MATKKKDDDGADDGGTDDGGTDDGGAGKGSDDGAGGGDGGGADGDDLESHLRKLVTEVVGKVLGDGGQGGAAGPRTSAAQDEGTIRRMVKEAQDTLRAEEAKTTKLESVAETVETLKKAVERPPARAGLGGRLQRVMWGSDD